MNKRIIALILIVLIFFFGFISYVFTGININTGTEYLECEVYEDCFLPDVQAEYRGELLDIKVTDSVNYNLLGEYTVTYKTEKFLIPKSKKVVVRIVDTAAPILKLNGSMMILTNNVNFDDPLYTVTDNYDTEISVEVSYEEIIEEGIYSVEYRAVDSSGNVSYKYRDIWYREDFKDFNPDSSVFDLSEISKTASKRETPLEFEDLGNYWFIGDSIIRDLGYNAFLPAKSVLAYPALGPVEMDTSKSTFMNIDSDNTPFTLLSWYKPDKVVYNFGICSMETTSMDQLIDEFEVMLNGTNIYSDGAKVYIVSILPIKGNEAGTKPNNESINTMNYLLAELCDYRYIQFINVAEALKDESGYGKAEYYENDGYHLNETGQEVYIEYIKNYLGD